MLHREDPDLFRDAVQFTAGEMSLSPALVEKDYFCSVVLAGLASHSPPLTFKGGTALAKVHVGFYRMSEDLDFSIPISATAPRSERSRAATPLRALLDEVARATGVEISRPLTGSNSSRQYAAALSYPSLLGGASRSIQVEVGLREPLLLDAESRPVKTMLRDPVSREAALPDFEFRTLSFAEAFAEKFRAALTRRVPAIRDFYDIDVLTERNFISATDETFLALVRAKLRTPGTGPIALSDSTLATLRAQIPHDLQPMLRQGDLGGFDLDRSFDIARALVASL